MRLWTGSRLYVSAAAKAFDAEGNLVDESVRQRLKAFMAGYGAFVAGATGAS